MRAQRRPRWPAALLLLLLGQAPRLRGHSDEPNDSEYLNRPQFLATHGGFSYYKVYINPSHFRANQPITDDVVAATCIAASRGAPPMAPCQSSSSACKYFSGIHCKATSEQGCEQPMLTTALAMGCSSALDPACRERSEGSLVGTNYGCLWAHMGLAWGGNGACGNCHCTGSAWGTGFPTARAGDQRSTCATLEKFCQPGSQFTVDGLIWPYCEPNAAPSGSFSCVGTGAPGAAWPNNRAEHWAFCVGRAVCKCVHGKCDIASEQGNCQLGTCGRGWSGPLCNQPCGPTFCLGRNNPAVTAPLGVQQSDFNGVWTNNQNQCHCECLSQYGPSGAGPQGTICGNCIQPGQLECTAYTGTYLSSTTPVNTVPRNTQFTVNVDARFVQNDQVDTSIAEIITVSKDPGGGNGDGGQLTVHTSNAQMNQGQVSMVLEFSDACDACYLTFRDTKGILQPLKYGPIKVTTSGTHIMPLTSHSTVNLGDTVIIRLQAVDGPVGSTGSVDTTSPAVVRARLQTAPDGGNGGGCSITPVSPSTSLTQNFVGGQAEWRVKFGCACDACVVVFEDTSTTRTLPTYFYNAIKVVSGAHRLQCRTRTGAECGSAPITLKRRSEVFDVYIQAADSSGNLDRGSSTTVTVSKFAAGGVAGDGGQLLNAGGTKSLTQTLINGQAEYALSFTQACDACILTASDTGTNVNPLLPYTFPAIYVYSDAIRLAVVNSVTQRVRVGERFEVVVEARDDAGYRDVRWNGKVGASLLPNGGNGDGGALQNFGDAQGLVTTLQNGTYTFHLSFTASCSACIVEIVDVTSSNQRLNPVQLLPILVYTSRERLTLKDPLRSSVQRGVPFEMVIVAVDGAGNIDTSDTSRVSLALEPGGGNGDGGQLTDPLGLDRSLELGLARFNPVFGKACTACRVRVTHASPAVPPLIVGPIQVQSAATKLTFTAQVPEQVQRNAPFPLSVRAVDNDGNLDPSPRGSFRLEVSADSSGRRPAPRQYSGQLTDAGSAATMQKVMTDGVVSWNPQFSKACSGCFLQVRDVDGGLPVLRSNAIRVTTTASKLVADTPWAVNVVGSNQVARTVAKGQPYDVAVLVVDESGDRDVVSQLPVTATLEPNGGNGDGAPLGTEPAGMLTQTSSSGRAAWRLVHPRACTACRVTFVAGTDVRPVTFPPVRVTTTARKVMVTAPPPASVRRGDVFELALAAVDENGDTDTDWRHQVSVALRPNGGNGDGGDLRNNQGSTSLQQYYNQGVYTYRLSFSAACLACILEVRDLSGSLPTLVLNPILVTTDTARLRTSLLSTTRTMRGVPFTVEAAAVDADGNINPADQSQVSLALAEVDATGQIVREGLLPMQGGEARRLTDGKAVFNVQVDDDCTSCMVVAQYAQGTGGTDSLQQDRGAASRLMLPAHDAALSPQAKDASNAAARSSDDSGDDYQLLFWIILGIVLCLILILALILIALLRRRAKLKKRKRQQEEEEMRRREEEAHRSAFQKSLEPMSSRTQPYVPIVAPLDGQQESENPIESVFGKPEYQEGPQSPGSGSPRGDRPWMLDVEANAGGPAQDLG
eukprot:TRINITY_DN64949_c0_g1_i1.p1 TRINITY_DN64949_c0_g1~~TRINITY_DN64949_c0_g1_i1.p1  ORF type:complete len:1556 (+),score=561.70 TRINITY_DN64949_c0_g1_i1:72-4739(+)